MSKTTLFLMNQKGFETLKHINEKLGSDVIEHVVSTKDPTVQKDFYQEIKQFSEENKIKFYEKKDAPKLAGPAIAIGWRWIIPDAEGLIVLHDSLLPKYRGFAPLVSALVNGEKKVGVTALKATTEYDKGNIISQKSIELSYPIKIQEAIEKVSELYKEISEEVIKKISSSEQLEETVQNESEASYSLWRNEDDYEINWEKDSETIERLVNATGFPFKGACTSFRGEKYRILSATSLDDVAIENRTAGKVIFLRDGEPTVVCGKGLLTITEMILDKNKKNALPLKRFRTKFE